MIEKITEIENHWCVYNYGFGPAGFGKIIKDNGKWGNILYSEGQHYLPEPWDFNYVTIFNKLEDAANSYAKGNNISEEEIKELMITRFPSYFKK